MNHHCQKRSVQISEIGIDLDEMQIAIDVVFVVRYVFLNELMGSIHRPHQGDLLQRRTVKNDEDHVKKSEEGGDAEKEFERVHFGRNV